MKRKKRVNKKPNKGLVKARKKMQMKRAMKALIILKRIKKLINK